jgi:hypothetical protein
VPGLDFSTPEKKIRANIRYWEAKVLLRRIGAQDREKKGGLGSTEIGVFCDPGTTLSEMCDLFYRKFPGRIFLKKNAIARKFRVRFISKRTRFPVEIFHAINRTTDRD